MKRLAAFLAVALALACLAALPAERGRLTLWVATVLCENRDGYQMLSFVDAERNRDLVAKHLDVLVAEKFPGARVVSIKIEPVSEELIARMCEARAAERRF